MEERILPPPRRRGWRWALVCFLVLALLAAGGWFVFFIANRFTLSIRLAGEPSMYLEYGQFYKEPGAEVILRGTLFWREGIVLSQPELQISGGVEEAALGKNILTYSADFLGHHTEVQRSVRVVDTVCPVITLAEGGELGPGGVFQEPGFTATDNFDGDITGRVVRLESPGLVTYAVVDSSGNPCYAEREIPLYTPKPPEIHLEGGEYYSITTGSFYSEPGYWAADSLGVDLTEQVSVEGEVNWLEPGIYPITYTVTDGYDNVTAMTRQVEVSAVPRPQTVWPQEKTIYLSFDDGPSPYTKQLLDVLDRYGVKATFFVTDSGYGEMMKQIVKRGHSIGIHTVSHNYGEIYSSPEAYFTDLHRMQDIIYENTGVRTTLLRFPGGSSNTVSRSTCEGLMSILSEAVQNAGFQYFDWNVDSDDAGGARKAETVFRNVVDGVKQTGISLVLQHDIHGYSVDAVEDILAWGLENGYAFRPLAENSPGFHHGINN